MSENTTPEEVLEPAPTETATPEQIVDMAAEEFIAQNKQQMKAVKAFCAMVASIPDTIFPLTDENLDKIFEPRTQELYKTLKRDNITFRQLEDGINRLMALFADQSIVRCRNFTDVMIKQLNFEVFGYYEPIKEMPIKEIETVLHSLQNKDGQPKETNTGGNGDIQD